VQLLLFEGVGIDRAIAAGRRKAKRWPFYSPLTPGQTVIATDLTLGRDIDRPDNQGRRKHHRKSSELPHIRTSKYPILLSERLDQP
jgi:hypothetical protein